MNGGRWQFVRKQFSRCRRFLAILPDMLASPRDAGLMSRELGRASFFHGFKGFKEFCRTLEQNRAARLNHPCAEHDPNALGYLICSQPYVSNSAGVGCTYRLCHELNVRGYPSFMVDTHRTAPQWVAPLISWSHARRLARSGYTAVYAETVTGNPLHARSVARWVLNRPGLLGGCEV